MTDRGMKKELFNELRQIIDDLDGGSASDEVTTLSNRANDIINELEGQAQGLVKAVRDKTKIIDELEADLEDLEFTLENPEAELWDWD